MNWMKRIAVLAGAAALTLTVLTGIGSAVGQAVPSNTSLPSIGGSAKDGSVLTASHGSWTGSPTSYDYAWQRCDTAGGNCAAIAGATSKQYTLVTADVNQRVRVVVTATNASGSGTATSRPTATVAATGQAPQNTSAPTISGTPKENSALTVDNGGWSGTQPITFAYQWQRCDATGGNCANLAGATSTSYTATSADVAGTLRVNVTASNGRGSTLATSGETAVVAPAAGGTGHVLAIAQVSLPNRLIVDSVKFAPAILTSRAAVVARFHVSDTRLLDPGCARLCARASLRLDGQRAGGDDRRHRLGDDHPSAHSGDAAAGGRARDLRPRTQAGRQPARRRLDASARAGLDPLSRSHSDPGGSPGTVPLGWYGARGP